MWGVIHALRTSTGGHSTKLGNVGADQTFPEYISVFDARFPRSTRCLPSITSKMLSPVVSSFHPRAPPCASYIDLAALRILGRPAGCNPRKAGDSGHSGSLPRGK